LSRTVAARATVVQTTPVRDSCVNQDYIAGAGAREGEGPGEWREEVRRWREGHDQALVPNGLSCVSYVGAPVLEASGNLLRQRLRFGVSEPPFRSWRRGEVRPWSKASRRRLRETLHRVKWARHGDSWVVVTLTLPGNDVPMCRDGRVIRAWRRAFLRRWWRQFGKPEYAWKQEFQARGAVHFAVVMPCPSSALAQSSAQLADLRRWVGRAWFEVVGSGATSHLRAGTNVTLVRDVRALSSYIVGEVVKGRKSKEYQHFVPEDHQHVGRWWGVSRGLCEPISRWVQTPEQAYATRRLLARMVRGPGYRRWMRRSMRRRVSSSTVFVREDALALGWRLQELRR